MFSYSGTPRVVKGSDYIVTICPITLSDIQYVVNVKDTEVGWLNFVEQISDKHFHIEGIVIPKQEVNGTTTEISPEGLMELTGKLSMEDLSKMKCWGHSHVNMAPTPSSQDDTTFDQLFSKESGHDFFIRMIANKKGEMKLDIRTRFEGKEELEIHNILWYPDVSDQIRRLDEDLTKNVVRKVYTTPYSNTYQNGASNGHNHKNTNNGNFKRVSDKSKFLGSDSDLKDYVDYVLGNDDDDDEFMRQFDTEAMMYGGGM